MREFTCCNQNGHVTNCPRIKITDGGAVTLEDDHGGTVSLTVDEALALLEIMKRELMSGV